MPLKSNTSVKHSPVNVNAAGPPPFPNKGFKLLELPLELIMEILSHFAHVPVSTGRTHALRALSQTCRSWRNLFFPLLWERLEPSLVHCNRGEWSKVYGDSLIRKSSLVCENPEIAWHVRSMSVSLSRYSTATVLPACVRCIEALPNLHTLQIQAHHYMLSDLKRAFGGHVFPQVRTISLPSNAHHILRCCTEVRKIICISQVDSSTLVSAIAMSCKEVEEVQGFRGPENVMKRLAKAAPNLRSIKFDYPIPLSHLRHFSSLKKLAHITLSSNQAAEEQAMRDDDILACIKLAKDIVRKAQGWRSVTVKYHDTRWSLDPSPDWSRVFNVDV